MTRPDKLTFLVAGMGCPDCVSVIENAVMPLPGVAYVGVSLTSGTMTVRPAAGLDVARLKSTVSDLGYSLWESPVEPVITVAACLCGFRTVGPDFSDRLHRVK